MKASVSKLFLFGAIVIVIMGLITQWWCGNSALDIHLHDTYVVIAHFHIVLAVAIAFLGFSAIHGIFPLLFSRIMNRRAGLVHFWITLLGTLAIFWPMHYEGVAGMPRRYYDYSAWDNFKMYGNLNSFISIVVVLLFFAQVIFIANFLISIVAGKKVQR